MVDETITALPDHRAAFNRKIRMCTEQTDPPRREQRFKKVTIMAKMEKKKNLGIHILVCLGVMLLLGMQYLRAIGIAEIPVRSWADMLPLSARWLCLSGASLLAACMGYGLYDRKCVPAHFILLLRILYIYTLCSLGGFAMQRLILEEELELGSAVQSFFAFDAGKTSSIAGMLLALVLAAPFLNAAFKGLKTRRARLAFLLITAAAGTLQPTLQWGGIQLLPAWCKGLFPVAAYIGGMYIHRYSKKRESPLAALLLLGVFAGQSLLVFFLSLSRGFPFCPWLDSMATLPCLVTALCLVSVFHSRQSGTGPAHRFFSGASFGALSALLLGTPLIECLVPAFEETFMLMPRRLWAGFGVVPTIFVLCCALGLILQLPLILAGGAGGQDAPVQEKRRRKSRPPVPREDPEQEEMNVYAPEDEYAPDEAADGYEEPVVSSLPDPGQEQYAPQNAYIPRHGMETVYEQPSAPLPRREHSLSVEDILEEHGIGRSHASDSVEELISSLAGKGE